MRQMLGCALLVLAATAASAAPATLEGDWETVLASPKRPWIFIITFKPDGEGWNGTMSVRGFPDFPLRDIRVESTHVRFLLPPELDSLEFDGTLAGSEIAGHVVEDGRPTPMRLERTVPLPRPASRVEAWRQDLEYAAARVAEYDRSFTPASRRKFRQAVARLERDVARKSDAEILVALSRAVALADNAHTRLRLSPTAQGTFSTVFPMAIWWFSDGPYVVKAAPEYERALRCRVVAIDGHEISTVREKVSKLFAGNAGWVDYLAPVYLVRPDVLAGVGVTKSASQASFTFEDRQGARFTVAVRAVPYDRASMGHESWQELSPVTSTGKPPWASALADPASVPLYLRHPDQPYWFELLPDAGLLYVQLNHAGDAATGPTFAEFGESLLAFARQHPVRRVVIDLRLNSGGNLDVGRDVIKRLAHDETIDRRGRLFVVTGHTTFSAGLYHAAQLKQLSRAIFVGETVGDRLDFWAEGGQVVLPNSQASINYSNGFHRYSGKPYPEHQPYYEELNVPTLAPDLPVATSSTDYFAGRDPVLEAIEASPAIDPPLAPRDPHQAPRPDGQRGGDDRDENPKRVLEQAPPLFEEPPHVDGGQQTEHDAGGDDVGLHGRASRLRPA